MIFSNKVLRHDFFSPICGMGLIMLLLAGCASSSVSRHAATQFDRVTADSSSVFDGTGESSLSDSYQNSSQMAKGAVMGGAAGAIAGSVTQVGFFTGAAGGLLFGGVLGAYLDAHANLADQLTNRRVMVVVLGDQILLELPSRHMFNGMTAKLNPYAFSTLDLVAQFISRYPNRSVQISAYTNASRPERIYKALSQEQAESVMKYLWRRGINTRLLSATGYGGQKLVEENSADWNKGENYRIEITLEKLPV